MPMRNRDIVMMSYTEYTKLTKKIDIMRGTLRDIKLITEVKAKTKECEEVMKSAVEMINTMIVLMLSELKDIETVKEKEDSWNTENWL